MTGIPSYALRDDHHHNVRREGGASLWIEFPPAGEGGSFWSFGLLAKCLARGDVARSTTFREFTGGLIAWLWNCSKGESDESETPRLWCGATCNRCWWWWWWWANKGGEDIVIIQVFKDGCTLHGFEKTPPPHEHAIAPESPGSLWF